MKTITYPIFLLLLCFLIDKIFVWDEVQVRSISWKRFEKAAYETRFILLDLLEKEHAQNPNKNYILLLGSSRTAQMKRAQVEDSLPNSTFYNFAVPYPGMAYQYYWLEKVLEKGIKPNTIILELDSLLLTNTANNYSIAYLFDLSFIWEHFHWFESEDSGFSKKEFFQFIKTRLFTISRYPFSWEALLDNQKKFIYMEEGKLVEKTKREVIPQSRKALIDLIHSNHGGISSIPNTQAQIDFSLEAKQKWNQYFFAQNFPSNSQIYFLGKILAKAQENQIPIILLIPQTSPEFRKILLKSEVAQTFSQILQEILTKNPSVQLLDLSSNAVCTDFEDSFHVAENCIQDFTSRVIQMIPRQ